MQDPEEGTRIMNSNSLENTSYGAIVLNQLPGQLFFFYVSNLKYNENGA